MNSEQQKRAKNCILGAFVADAATMGFHWMYSQRRISELAPDQPEFRQPDEEDYDGNVGYFAHGKKRAGELSQYGEQMQVMLTSLAENDGHYNKQHYQEQFRLHFGYGGDFRGYIDRPTRQTLDRIYRDESDALDAVNLIPFSGDTAVQQGMLTKVLAAAKRFSGERLRDQIEVYASATAVPEQSLEYGLALADALVGSEEFPGAIDEQLPAISKLPPLIACHVDDPHLEVLCSSAVRVTNNAPRAVDFGMVSAQLLKAAIQGEPMSSAIAKGVAAGTTETQQLLNRALSMDVPVREVTREFGLHCDLGSGTASLLANLKTASSFVDAIRQNLYAGGDNCGRAIVLGAVCGAHFDAGSDGIPEAWVSNLADGNQIQSDIDRLFVN
ncbi:MAG: ADP-ribosylglycohydrolase family protein [Arenicellales bacterium]|nr:ADP-ribosylglycohydrolase family protein [Arenicellales bacterium]